MEEINLESIVNAVNPFTKHHNDNKSGNRKSINKEPAELLRRSISQKTSTLA